MAHSNDADITTSANRDRNSEYANIDRETAYQLAQALVILGSLYAILALMMFV